MPFSALYLPYKRHFCHFYLQIVGFLSQSTAVKLKNMSDKYHNFSKYSCFVFEKDAQKSKG